MKSRPSKLEAQRRIAGYTLLELVVASASATVLVGGLASSLFIGSQSLDVGTGSLSDTRTAHQALATINRDLQSAITISNLSATAVVMAVPDRDGDNVPEIVNYYWSGIAGDPLYQEYNGAAATVLADDVQSFSLTWLTRLIEGVSTRPVVLFVSRESPEDSDGLTEATSDEKEHVDLIKGWGYDVTVISDEATQTNFDNQFPNANVVFVSGAISTMALGPKLNNTPIGVVTESFDNAEELGFYSSLAAQSTEKKNISITNNSHYITSTHITGDLVVMSRNKAMKWTSSTLAPDAVTLANVDLAVNYPTLLILDKNDILAGGGIAAGRRCQLPWGEGAGMDISKLTTDGETLMQRAIEWAAGAGDDTNAASGLVFHEFTEAQVDSNSSNVTLSVPPGYAGGDLLIAAVATDGNSTPMTAPTGWNQVLVAANGSSVTLGVWWKLADSTEPSNYTFTWTGSEEQAYAWMMRFTGHNPLNPIHTTANDQGYSNSPTTPAVTTTVDNCMILRIGAFDDDDINVGDTNIMTGHTTITANESNNGTSTASGAAAHDTQITAGDTGPAGFSLTGTEQWRTLTIALEPDPNP